MEGLDAVPAITTAEGQGSWAGWAKAAGGRCPASLQRPDSEADHEASAAVVTPSSTRRQAARPPPLPPRPGVRFSPEPLARAPTAEGLEAMVPQEREKLRGFDNACRIAGGYEAAWSPVLDSFFRGTDLEEADKHMHCPRASGRWPQ